MLFDSLQMNALRQKYHSVSEYRVPKIVVLDRFDRFVTERRYLENLVSVAPASKYADWVGRLISEDDEQHFGAWFEIMLSGWLQPLGTVDIAPNIEQNDPDFVLHLGSERTVIEARAVLLDKAERNQQRREHEIMWALQQIRMPFMVTIEAYQCAEPIRLDSFTLGVTKWLHDSPDTPFEYRDELGNKVNLVSQKFSEIEHVHAMQSFQFVKMSGDPVKAPLREKAGQHRKVRKAGYPYVIALFLESWTLSAEEVVSAWFGNLEAVYDSESGELLDQRLDRSGIHYWKREIRHRSVSGTLVFKRDWSPTLGRHFLRAWYVQNPFADVQLDPTMFPVESRYIILQRMPTRFSMGWRPIIE